MSERWLPVPGYEGKYEVSDHGRVRSLAHTIVVVSKGVTYSKRVAARIRCLGYQRGYPHVTLGKHGVQITHKVHALVLLAFVGPRPKGLDCCHNDGDRTNNRLDNLRYDTRRGNMKDATNSGSYFSEKRKAHLRKFAELGRVSLTEMHRLRRSSDL
jgi:hypothetical protein